MHPLSRENLHIWGESEVILSHYLTKYVCRLLHQNLSAFARCNIFEWFHVQQPLARGGNHDSAINYRNSPSDHHWARWAPNVRTWDYTRRRHAFPLPSLGCRSERCRCRAPRSSERIDESGAGAEQNAELSRTEPVAGSRGVSRRIYYVKARRGGLSNVSATAYIIRVSPRSRTREGRSVSQFSRCLRKYEKPDASRMRVRRGRRRPLISRG